MTDRRITQIAATRRGLITRPEVLAANGSDRVIEGRCESERWQRVHAGVYLVGVAPLDWRGQLHAAVLAAGEGAAASHRAALVVWGLDGIGAAPLEITVPVTHRPVPAGVLVHRTRRPVPVAHCGGIDVTTVERTILDVASCLPPVVVEKAFESAVRKGLTTATKVELFVRAQGGKGVRGSTALKEILAERAPGRAAGSPAEVELLRALRRAGVAAPVRQYEIALSGGAVATVDLAWPERRKAVEVDGIDAHATAEALDRDDERQNELCDAGWELRRYSARTVHRHPQQVAQRVARFLRG